MFQVSKAARTLIRHNMNRQKNRISCMDTAHIDSMQHTRTWKKTYIGNDRQLQSSHKKIATQNRNINKTNSSYVN